MNTLQSNQYKVLFYNLNYEDDAFAFDRLLNSSAGIELVDTIAAQLIDLVKIKYFAQYKQGVAINELINQELNGAALQEYGIWVYYPWRRQMVHLLSEDDFIVVRTNRNKNKITEEEQEQLQKKKIGVIGLSVGQSVAITIAMERIAGEIWLADFDNIELSNCNRIRTSIFNIGLSKAIVVAREIAEIDPFIKLKIFNEGITDQNIQLFFDANNPLDCVIEECDDIAIKILARQYAKQLGIPIIMEMSDQGMIDIERYDLEPNYLPFHGRVQHLDITSSTLNKLTPLEKFNYLYTMVDGDNISARLQSSVLEIGNTLITWPQLATAVVLGGAVSADVARRILLKQLNSSGRFYVNLDKLIH
jgi:molybdopterin/thiamine biosynthesis adenylyltransferase